MLSGREWNCRNLAANGPEPGFGVTGNGLTIDFPGRPYLVAYQGTELLDEGPADFNHHSLLIHCFLSEGRGQPLKAFQFLNPYDQRGDRQM